MADAFRILLNTISVNLNDREVDSLVLMCNIPEALRAKIKNGMGLFDNLFKRGIISEHELDELKTMLKNLNPKRRDLVGLIEKFENGSSSQTDSLGRTSTTSVLSFKPSNDRHETSKSTTAICCTLDCPCMTVECRKFSFKITWSFVVLTILFSICFLIVALFWYADVPKITESIASHEHLKGAGPYILIAIGVVYVLCLSSMCYLRKRRKRRSYKTAERHNDIKANRSTKSSKSGIVLSRANSRTSATNYGFSRYNDGEDARIMVEDEANQDTESPPT